MSSTSSTELPALPALPANPSDYVLIIQHSDRVPCGYVGEFFQALQPPVPTHSIRIDLYGEKCLPSTDIAWKAIIALGGPQGSYEEDQHPFLKAEKAFLRSYAFSRLSPVLGICLGCQLLADALGGKVYKAPSFEVGYPPFILTESGKQDPIAQVIFNEQFAQKTANTLKLDESTLPALPAVGKEEKHTHATAEHSPFLLHHGDTFHLPAGVDILAKTDKYTQLWRWSEKPEQKKLVTATQFHPEAGLPEMLMWTAWDPKRYLSIGRTYEDVLQEVVEAQPRARYASYLFFKTWWSDLGFECKMQE